MQTESIAYCAADPNIVQVIQGRTKLTTTDMQDAINTAKPDILEAVAGLDEPLKLDPVGPEDVEKAKKLQLLANIIIKRRNPWYRRCHDFIDSSMKLIVGYFKYRYVKKTVETKRVYQNLNDIELQAKVVIPGATVLSDEIKDGIRNTEISYSKTTENIEISTIPSNRLKFPIDTRDFYTCPFAVEEIMLYENEFITTYGQEVFDKVKKAVDTYQISDSDYVESKKLEDLGGLPFLYDKNLGKYKAYECYFPETKTQKPWAFTFAGEDIIIIDEENKYGKPPYNGGSPFMIADRLIGQGYLHIIKETMKRRTFLDRQIFDNITQSNFRRNFVNIAATGLDIDAYQNNNVTNAIIPFTNILNEQTFREETKTPLPAEVYAFRETLLQEKDAHIPTPRAYAGVDVGLDPNVKTFRGQRLKVNQSAKKLLMMIRGYMEDVFRPLFEDVIFCIENFMSDEEIARILGEQGVSFDDLRCNYDIVVNVGLGSHDKDDLVAKLQQYLGLMIQTTPLMLGIHTAENFAYIFEELAKAMGFLNTSDFVTDPQLKDTVTQFISEVSKMMQMLSQHPENKPIIDAMMPEFQKMTQTVMQALGVAPQPQQGGQNGQGSYPGQNTPQIQVQPAQPMQDRGVAIDGGGYFA